jgi:hypothetical protein
LKIASSGRGVRIQVVKKNRTVTGYDPPMANPRDGRDFDEIRQISV